MEELVKKSKKKLKHVKEISCVGFKMLSSEESDTEEGQFGLFEGYAATFGNMDRVNDVIVAGAFKQCLQSKSTMRLCWQHDMREPIGSVIEMREDTNGLFIKGRLNLGTERGREAYALLKAGDLNSMSIGYYVVDYEIDTKTGIRYLKQIDLLEISVVTEPANTRALVTSVKALINDAESLEDVESVLRKKGFSRKEARALVSKIKKFSQCDAERTLVSQCDAGVDIQLYFAEQLKQLTQQLSKGVYHD